MPKIHTNVILVQAGMTEHKKYIPMQSVTLLLACMLLTLTLTGCGKKPNFVDPPESVVDDHFPRIYPNPATDPLPEGSK